MASGHEGAGDRVDHARDRCPFMIAAFFMDKFGLAAVTEPGGINRLAARHDSTPRKRAGIGFRIGAPRLPSGTGWPGFERDIDPAPATPPRSYDIARNGCRHREGQGGPK